MRVERQNILNAIDNCCEDWTCPQSRGCNKPEADPEACRKCADKILAKFEDDVRAEAVRWTREIIKEFVKEWNMQSHKRIPYFAAEELDEHIMQRALYRREDEAKQ